MVTQSIVAHDTLTVNPATLGATLGAALADEEALEAAWGAWMEANYDPDFG